MIDFDKVTVVQNNIRAHRKTKDQDVFLHDVVEITAQTLNVYFVGIHLIDQSREYIVLKAGSGILGEKLLAVGHKVRIAAHNAYMDQVSTTAYYGQIKLVDWLGDKISTYQVYANEVSEIELENVSYEYFRSPILPRARIELYLPLQVSAETIGILELTFDTQFKLSENEILRLQQLANELALVIC